MLQNRLPRTFRTGTGEHASRDLALSLMGAVIGLSFILLPVDTASAAVITLGEPDFIDDVLVGSASEFDAASAGEPAPFDRSRGSDSGAAFSEAWTFAYAAGPVYSASITIGIADHDSAAAGNQVEKFSVDGIDLTFLLNTAFNAEGGTQDEYNVYTINIPSIAFADLADGLATFLLILQGPGLGGTPGSTSGTTPSNGAGLDYAMLSLNVAEPMSLALFATGLSLGFLVRRGRRLPV